MSPTLDFINTYISQEPSVPIKVYQIIFPPDVVERRSWLFMDGEILCGGEHVLFSEPTHIFSSCGNHQWIQQGSLWKNMLFPGIIFQIVVQLLHIVGTKCNPQLKNVDLTQKCIYAMTFYVYCQFKVHGLYNCITQIFIMDLECTLQHSR